MNKAIFLDRDGTVNVEVDYLYKAEDFRFEYKADEAIKILNDLGYKIIIVTNQSGIARGYYTEEDLVELHKFLDGELCKVSAKVDGYYYCPHHTKGTIEKYKIECNCRKPNLGMFLEAGKKFDIDFANSFIVGDKMSDLEAGLRLGMSSILVQTGHGEDEEKSLYFKAKVYKNLYDFAIALKSANI